MPADPTDIAACGYCDQPRSMNARDARCGFPSNHAPTSATAACPECGMNFYHLATCSSLETLVASGATMTESAAIPVCAITTPHSHSSFDDPIDCAWHDRHAIQPVHDPAGRDMTLTPRDRALTMALIDHAMALDERRAQRTEEVWPDESDIFAATRAKIYAADPPPLQPTERVIEAAAEVLTAWDTYMNRSQAAEWEEQEDWARVKAGMKVLRKVVGNPAPADASRLAIEVQAVNDWIRETLEDLARTAGLPAKNLAGAPLRNWQLVDHIKDQLVEFRDAVPSGDD